MLRVAAVFVVLGSTGCVHVEADQKVWVLKRTETSVLVAYEAPASRYDEESIAEEIRDIGDDSCMEGYDVGKAQTESKAQSYSYTTTSPGTSRQDCQQVFAGHDPFTGVSRFRTDCRTVWSHPSTSYQTGTRFVSEHRRWIVCREDEVEVD